MLDSVITEETHAKMAFETRTPSIARFGTFEVDLRAGELRKQGKRLKLQEQPFQVLVALLQRPGDVVTREELRSQIWPEDTFVDFDNSLNTAINKLREALGDSADNPHFIETLPRRGYRFLAPVRGGAQNAPEITRNGRKIAIWGAVCSLFVTAATGALLWRSSRARVLTEKDTIVLGDFSNQTGDPVFDGTLREGLSVQLEQSPFLSLVSEEGIHQTLRMMGQPANARLTLEITREVCQRTNSGTALHGSIALIGNRYSLILKAVRCMNGDLLAGTEAQANDKNHVLDALSKAASEMRTKLGESLTTVQKYNTPLELATTPSLEALRAYTLGYKTFLEGDSASALPFFQRATHLDPNFAMAFEALGDSYSYLGETALADETAHRALELRERLTELEKLKVECDSALDLTKGIHSCEVGAKTYPREPYFHWVLVHDENFLGRYEAGLEEIRQAIRLAPYNALYYRLAVATYVHLDRVSDAEAAAKEAEARGLDTNLASILYQIGFYRGDDSEMARQVANVAGKAGYEDLLLALEADTAAYSGLLGKARELSRQAANSAELAAEKETAAGYSAVSALREGLFGNAERARHQATALAKAPSTWRDMRYALALALAYSGDTSRAHALADDLAQRFPEDTIVQFNCVPTLRAKLGLLHSNPQQSFNELRVVAPYELGLPAVGLHNWPNLYSVYVRGEAYLATHQGREAAAEFQKILDHRGIVLNEPIGALAHLQLGRAYALQGDQEKARGAYQDFLTLWKDADLDIPILQDAKAEYAKLR